MTPFLTGFANELVKVASGMGKLMARFSAKSPAVGVTRLAPRTMKATKKLSRKEFLDLVQDFSRRHPQRALPLGVSPTNYKALLPR